MAEPVLLVSSDPFLGASLEAVARGRIRVARLDPSRLPAAWPAGPTATVVLDVAARQRDAVHAWVRRHHPGLLVVLLKPGERQPALPPDPALVVVGRPFRVADLVDLLEHPPDPSAPDPPPPPPAPEPPAPEPEQAVPAATPPGAGRRARDLLQASATQRMRRLGSLAGAAPAPSRPGPPGTPGPAPRPAWPTAATQLEGRRRRRGRRGRRAATRVLVGLLVVLVLAGAWLGLGLLEARQDLLVGAEGVRAELARAEAALERGRPAEAAGAVDAARRSVEVAATVPERGELRVAAHLPVLSGGIADVRHLLAAASGLTGAAERAVAVARQLGPGESARLAGGRVDLDAVEDAAAQARAMVAELEGARGELERVRGGLFAPGAAQTRHWMTARTEDALARARRLLATLEARRDTGASPHRPTIAS